MKPVVATMETTKPSVLPRIPRKWGRLTFSVVSLRGEAMAAVGCSRVLLVFSAFDMASGFSESQPEGRPNLQIEALCG